MDKVFLVGVYSRIAGGNDCTYVLANNEAEALKIGVPMLDTHKLVPDFLNDYSKIYVREA
jgi:hypothetical protein